MHHEKPTHTQHIPASVRVVSPEELSAAPPPAEQRPPGPLEEMVDDIRRRTFGRGEHRPKRQ